MSPEVQARLFEPSFTTMPPEKGTGLGRATVRAIVDQLGGRLRVISRIDEGTCVEVILPRTETEPVPPTHRPVNPPQLPPRRGTVLLVEDDAAVRLFTRQTLEQVGYLVVEAHDGAEALLIAEQLPGALDLVVSDVVLPRLGGPELERRLSASHPEAHFLFMSGYPRGAIGSNLPFLEKPFTSESLLAALSRIARP